MGRTAVVGVGQRDGEREHGEQTAGPNKPPVGRPPVRAQLRIDRAQEGVVPGEVEAGLGFELEEVGDQELRVGLRDAEGLPGLFEGSARARRQIETERMHRRARRDLKDVPAPTAPGHERPSNAIRARRELRLEQVGERGTRLAGVPRRLEGLPVFFPGRHTRSMRPRRAKPKSDRVRRDAVPMPDAPWPR